MTDNQPEVSPDSRYEFARAFVAAVRLAQLDLRAVDLFEKTPEAAWRSTRFLLYCIPLVMIMVWPQAAPYIESTGYSKLSYAIISALQVMIAAFGFFLVMHHMTLRLGVHKNFAHYVCVECYIALPVFMLVTLLTSLWTAAGVSDNTAGFLQVLVYALQILIDWAVTYATLRVKPAVAFSICIMGVLFSRVVQLVTALFVILSIPAAGSIMP